MFDIIYLTEFSRTHCLAICAFLVPANLLLTGLVLWGCYRQRRDWPIYSLSLTGCLFPCLLFAHISTWLMIGVVMPPTFILLGLGLTCLAVHLKALSDREGFGRWLEQLVNEIKSRFFPLLAK